MRLTRWLRSLSPSPFPQRRHAPRTRPAVVQLEDRLVPAGDLLWTDQFGSASSDGAFGVAADASGFYVSGFVRAPLLGQTYVGGYDGFLLKLTDPAPTTPPPRVSSVAVLPAINNGPAERSLVTGLAVTFDSAVTLPSTPASAFQLVRTGGGAVTLAVSTAPVNGGTVATLTFSGAETEFGSLRDGNYTLTVFGSASMFHIELIHGPTPTTTSSQAIVPADVSTAEIAVLPLPERKPVTATPETISTPTASALRASNDPFVVSATSRYRSSTIPVRA